jgi:hypothetical protein
MLRDSFVRRPTRSTVWLAALGAGLATLTFFVVPREASAFCRSTSCTEDCPRDLDGCKTSGEPLWWANSCVGFSLQRDASEHIPMKYVRQVATRSFTAWSDLECETGYATLAFSELEEAECKRTEYNDGGKNSNIILFQDTKWDYKGADNTLAKTTVTFDAETGEIFDADIEINHAYNNFTISDEIVDYDLESVLTHEVGHLIGLDHTPDYAATMYAGYEPGSMEQRSLEPDDVLGACTAYPPERDAVCDPRPRGGFGSVCGDAVAEDLAEAACSFGAVGGGERGGRSSALVLAGLALLSATRRRPRLRA